MEIPRGWGVLQTPLGMEILVVWGSQKKIPSMGWGWIFSGTTQYSILVEAMIWMGVFVNLAIMPFNTFDVLM